MSLTLSIRMNNRTILLASIGAAACLVCQNTAIAGTATNEEASSGQNIFSCPNDDSTVPIFTESKNGPNKMRQLLGNGKDDIPDFRHIRMLPSLTADQRKEFMQRFQANKARIEQLTGQMRQLRQKNQRMEESGNSADMESRDKFMQLRAQVQELRQNTWNEIKAKLSEKQLADLQAMRKGVYPAATFNEASMQPKNTMR